MSVAVRVNVRDGRPGDAQNGRGAASSVETPERRGPPPRHIDLQTALLDRYARSWLDLQQTRKAMAQRDMPDEIVAEFRRLEDRVSRLLQRTLRSHDLWPWLSQFPGLGGAHTALVIGRIGDPRRYPGQRCSEGHYLPPLYAVGDPCPVVGNQRENDAQNGDGQSFAVGRVAEIDALDGCESSGADDLAHALGRGLVCPGTMFEPRTTSGTRSLWHWCGLHVEDDGRAPRKRKGHKATWEPRVRASVMQPGGIAEQIVRLNVPHYADVYREAKERLVKRVESVRADERTNGSLNGGGVAEGSVGIDQDTGRPLRQFEADRIARKVAAKAFLGDLLAEWKRR